MNCPKCNKPMVIYTRPEGEFIAHEYEHVAVLGGCENCHYEGVWDVITYDDGFVLEFNLHEYSEVFK